MPDYLPAHRELVLSAAWPRPPAAWECSARKTSKVAGWWLIATLVAIFPANVNMALNPDRYKKIPKSRSDLGCPIQALFILWVWRVAIKQR